MVIIATLVNGYHGNTCQGVTLVSGNSSQCGKGVGLF